MTTDDFLGAASDFNLPSLRDLLAARDQFHLHLINQPHVVATAVGRNCRPALINQIDKVCQRSQ
jgi:hypothetical protein